MSLKIEFKKGDFKKEHEGIFKKGFRNHTKDMLGEEAYNSIVAREYQLLGVYALDKKSDAGEKKNTQPLNSDLYGGVVYRNEWGALDIKYLYLDSCLRGLGLGVKLMHKVFEIGLKHLGCKNAYLSTFSFEALGFYEKLGFQLEFTRNRYLYGIEEYYLVKDLTKL